METVSIIVPVYNAQKCISRCVDSILAQDYEKLEIILVNDGSKDDSGRIIDEKAKTDSRIKVIHKPNGGVSSTRNRGLAEATGQYVQFVDADDYLPKEATKLMVRSMESDASDMVIGDFYRVVGDVQSKKGSIAKSGRISRKEYADQMMLSPADLYYGVLWNKLYKRSIVEKYQVKMDENISFCEDMLFNLEYLLHVEAVSVLTVPVYYYIMTPGSLVEQGMNLPDIIDMKTNVISYYSKFYRDILSPVDYIERIPIIYGYMVAFSTDSFAFRLFNKREKQNEYAAALLQDSLLCSNVLTTALIHKYLNVVLQKYSVDAKDGKILYYMHLSKQPLSISQLEVLTEYTSVQISIAIGKLLTLKYIRREHYLSMDPLADSFSIANEKLEQDLEYIEQDCRSILFKNMSEEKRNSYLTLQSQINANILSGLDGT